MTDASEFSPRAATLLREQQTRNYIRTDRLFAGLLVFEWLAGVVIALLVSPRAWSGLSSTVHVHVWYALFLGAAICLPPAVIGLVMPGRTFTRHAIAAGQMLMSALLIHLTGGRIETHFHVFGSLAFLAIYRDWRVLITGSAVVAADHLIRGYYWPQSAYGVASGAQWRWVEHAAWVVFEDVFLVVACLQSVKDMGTSAVREAELELMYESAVSTAEARRAGMAEIAAGVLHNVGNVLNSVNVSVSLLDKQVKSSKVGGLSKAATLLLDHRDDIGAFIERDEKGKRLPEYLVKLSDTLAAEQEQMQVELRHLTKSVEHIKDIVNVQQQYAGSSTLNAPVLAAQLVQDAVRMNATATGSDIEVAAECPPGRPVLVDKHKVLQILMNLLSNAKHACDSLEGRPGRITVRSEQSAGRLRLEVSDNGMGISAENLAKVFSYGFTTRPGGHGFGLHSCALAAQEMGGSLTVDSDGPGCGARFVLDIPAGVTE